MELYLTLICLKCLFVNFVNLLIFFNDLVISTYIDRYIFKLVSNPNNINNGISTHCRQNFKVFYITYSIWTRKFSIVNVEIL